MSALTENVQQPLRYMARELDPITGLYYVRNRWYDPVMNRFVSEDPIGIAGGINTYAYAANSPTNLRDPSGLQPERERCFMTQFMITLWDGSTVSHSEPSPGCRNGASANFLQRGLSSAGAFWGRWGPHSAGFTIGASAEAGTSGMGAAASGNVAGGVFMGEQCGVSLGGEIGGGAFAGFAGDNTSTVDGHNSNANFVQGVSAGGAGGLFVSNAGRASQLHGRFDNVTVNTPAFSAQVAWGGGIWQLSVTWVGKSKGASISHYPTNTPVTGEVGCP